VDSGGVIAMIDGNSRSPAQIRICRHIAHPDPDPDARLYHEPHRMHSGRGAAETPGGGVIGASDRRTRAWAQGGPSSGRRSRCG
jgi:hypothetical protein